MGILFLGILMYLVVPYFIIATICDVIKYLIKSRNK